MGVSKKSGPPNMDPKNGIHRNKEPPNRNPPPFIEASISLRTWNLSPKGYQDSSLKTKWPLKGFVVHLDLIQNTIRYGRWLQIYGSFDPQGSGRTPQATDTPFPQLYPDTQVRDLRLRPSS